MATTSAPWESLPPAVLAKCLRDDCMGAPSDNQAYFATCKAFAKAMLSSEPNPRLTVDVNAFHTALAVVLGWAEECHALYSLKLQGAADQQPSNIQPLVQLLQQSNIKFSGAHEVTCKSLMLDSPGGLSAILPNLQELMVIDEGCHIAPGLLPLSGCMQLRKLMLDPYYPSTLPGFDHSWSHQLQHLNTLPSLSTLGLNVDRHPTSFLSLLAGQLTHLMVCTLSATASQKQEGLGHIAQLTSLRSLELHGAPLFGAIAASGLATLSTLPQLRHLTVDVDFRERDDDVYRALLQFPHLTSLHCRHSGRSPLQQSLVDLPCSWKQLTLEIPNLFLLAKLSLHSLSHLVHEGMAFSASQTVASVQAAADNLLRTQPPCTVSSRNQHFKFDFEEALEDELPGGATASSLVLAAKPLVPQNIVDIIISDCNEPHQMDAALVTALQEVLPVGITRMSLLGCDLQPAAWSQLAWSFPQLKELTVENDDGQSAIAVMAYYCARLAQHQGPGVPQAANIKVTWNRHNFDVDDSDDEEIVPEVATWLSSFNELNGQLQIFGLSARVEANARG